MKLATLKVGGRDGSLVAVSRDLSRAASAAAVVPTMLEALEHWDETAPALETLYDALNNNAAPGAFAFDQRACAAPLPRANQWLDASTYGAHGKLMKASLKLERQPHADFPLLLQGMPSDFLGPFDDEPLPSDDVDIDFECEIGVITGAVPARPTLDQAGAAIRLLVMLNDWTLRGVVPKEIASGFGFMRAKAPVAFGAVAITPDEAGEAWRNFRLNVRAKIWYNGKPWGDVSAAGMDYGFDQLVAEVLRIGACCRAPLSARDRSPKAIPRRLARPMLPKSGAMRSLLPVRLLAPTCTSATWFVWKPWMPMAGRCSVLSNNARLRLPNRTQVLGRSLLFCEQKEAKTLCQLEFTGRRRCTPGSKSFLLPFFKKDASLGSSSRCSQNYDHRVTSQRVVAGAGGFTRQLQLQHLIAGCNQRIHGKSTQGA